MKENTAKKDNTQLSIVQNRAMEFFKGAKGSHDWDHTIRVTRLCEHIGPVEGADMDVLIAASYLHDIGRDCQDRANGALCHASKGAEMAEDMLRDIAFSEEQKKNIIHCIRSHRFRGNHKPETIEAKILFDADKLDAIGAVGVARAYLFAGEVGAKLHNSDVNIEDTTSYSIEDTGFREYTVKLSKIKGRMLTREGKRIAEGRHKFMEAFFKRFLKEHGGEI